MKHRPYTQEQLASAEAWLRARLRAGGWLAAWSVRADAAGNRLDYALVDLAALKLCELRDAGMPHEAWRLRQGGAS